MTDLVYTDWIAEDDLNLLLTSPPAALDYMILEAVDEVVNLHPFQSEIDLKRFDAGRVFGANCEVRWQRDGQRFHTMLIGEIATPPTCLTKHYQELDSATYKPSSSDLEYYLWGEWSENISKWVEAQILHIFNYPSPPNRGRYRYKLKVTEYANLKTGEMEFYRFTGAHEELI